MPAMASAIGRVIPAGPLREPRRGRARPRRCGRAARRWHQPRRELRRAANCRSCRAAGAGRRRALRRPARLRLCRDRPAGEIFRHPARRLGADPRRTRAFRRSPPLHRPTEIAALRQRGRTRRRQARHHREGLGAAAAGDARRHRDARGRDRAGATPGDHAICARAAAPTTPTKRRRSSRAADAVAAPRAVALAIPAGGLGRGAVLRGVARSAARSPPRRSAVPSRASIGPRSASRNGRERNLQRALPELSEAATRRNRARHVGQSRPGRRRISASARHPHVRAGRPGRDSRGIEHLDARPRPSGRMHLVLRRISAIGRSRPWPPAQYGIDVAQIYRAANNPLVDRMIARLARRCAAS